MNTGLKKPVPEPNHRNSYLDDSHDYFTTEWPSTKEYQTVTAIYQPESIGNRDPYRDDGNIYERPADFVQPENTTGNQAVSNPISCTNILRNKEDDSDSDYFFTLVKDGKNGTAKVLRPVPVSRV